MTPHSPLRPHRALLAVAVAATLLLAGCGQDDANDSGAGASTSATPGTPINDAGSTAAQEDVFSVLSPWNRPVENAAVHPRSQTLLDKTKIRIGRTTDGRSVRQTIDEGVYINTTAWTVPVVAGGTPTLFHCRQQDCGVGDDDFTLAIPEDVDPATIYDGWYTVFDEANRTAYDFWRARREDDDSISYQYVQVWDLDGPGFKQPYTSSARGSGLPLFGGLIRPGELERCQINHALAISLPGPAAGAFLQPASSTDGNGQDLKGALPEGGRIRLDADFDLGPAVDPITGKRYPVTKAQERNAQCIVTALKTYGAILVDRAAVPTLYFQRIDTGRKEPLLNGYELQSMRIDDFWVINFKNSERYPYPQRSESVGYSALQDDVDEQQDASGGTQ